MYVRSSKRTNKDGSVVEYLHLAHNERHPDTGVPFAKILHNFGRADEVDRDQLVRLCRSIARVCKLVVHDPEETGGRLPLDENGLPEGVRFIRAVDLGAPLVIESFWKRIGLDKLFERLVRQDKLRVPYERALFVMTANRLCEPDSKLGVWDRWIKTAFLPSCEDLKLEQMYEAMDFLHEHIADVEKLVFANTANLFNLDVDVIFYDTTTASFCIDEEDDDALDEPGLRKFGRPKDGAWAPQIVVALAVTREGIPVRSWVFPGNTSDVTTIRKVREDLRDWNLGRAMFVGDSGMNSEDSREELARACGRYLLAARMASVKEVRDDVLSRPGRYKVLADNLEAKEVIVGEGVRERRYVVCFNPREADRQRKHRESVVEELETELSRHKSLGATQQWAVDLKASGRYGRYLRIVEGKLTIDRAKVRDVERYDGKWVIQTNDDSLTVDDMAHGYKALSVIERCFRSLKSTQIRMKPMYHWQTRRIEAHVKICVLALLIERLIEKVAQRPWTQIRNELRALQAARFQTERHQFHERSDPPKAVAGALRTLGVPYPERVLGISPLPDGE